MYCIDIQTSPPFSILVPYYNVYIRWSKPTDCNPNAPLTNFQKTLHNDPKSAGTRVSPKVETEGIINSGIYTVFGVTGPFTILKSPSPPSKGSSKEGNETMKQNFMSLEDTLFNVAALLSIILAAIVLFLL
ncbi:hypothetical protein F8M41_007903 [Gigaspora margarita]|uniref:Uncharacterized protein n=1 Tax=Gigaspora margarita TaxID=4874 RepID=A0A8H4EQY2_GIGMA|nr:hypothetical protein F8M41_007903 [Gigaspora margarita]